MRHIRGQSRQQATLFPESLEDLIPAEHLVRVLDTFVEQLSLVDLGFSKAIPAATGRPSYDPSDLLKLYLWGYMNQVQSTRRLEHASLSNVEVMWLLNRLSPDFKTLADYRRDNPTGLQRVCSAFVQFCRGAEVFSGERVAIDGSKFGGQNARSKNVSARTLTKRLKQTEKKIAAYFVALDEADAQETEWASGPEDVKAALAALESQKEAIQAQLEAMTAAGETQVSYTDPDARKMLTGQGEWVVGYNVQTAVETDTHVIVHHEVEQEVTDRKQLAKVATRTQEVLEGEELEVVADAGYSNASEAAKCEAKGVKTYVPKQPGKNTHGDYYERSVFEYDEDKDSYRCPAGEVLTFRGESAKGERTYRRKSCAGCVLKPQCTSAQSRSVTRLRHESALQAMDARARAHPDIMKQRAATVEHPFGTLKQILKGGKFLTKGLSSVKAEMSLAVLAYNMKRLINLKGTDWMIKALA